MRDDTPALLELLLATPQPMAAFDDQDCLRWANQAFRQAYGLRPGEMPSWEELIRLGHARERGTHIVSDDFEAWLHSAKSRRGKLGYRAIECDLIDGRWLLMAETTLRNGWMLCVATDITGFFTEGRALRVARDQALRVAMTDELTQLPNRRALMQQLQSAAQLQAPAFALALLDIDHFKRINDSHGHDTGDRVIQHFAGLLRQHTRRDDVGGRWGGEEFALVVLHPEPAVAQAMLERLLAAVRQSQPCAELPALRYTVSAGLALLAPGEELSSLVRRADEALYAAKRAGRDRMALAA